MTSPDEPTVAYDTELRSLRLVAVLAQRMKDEVPGYAIRADLTPSEKQRVDDLYEALKWLEEDRA